MFIMESVQYDKNKTGQCQKMEKREMNPDSKQQKDINHRESNKSGNEDNINVNSKKGKDCASQSTKSKFVAGTASKCLDKNELVSENVTIMEGCKNENNNCGTKGNNNTKNEISDNKNKTANADKKNVEGSTSKKFQDMNVAEEINNEDDGEDLPDNFFDDFSNTDFMAGLDIVDDWIDDDEPEKSCDIEIAPETTKISTAKDIIEKRSEKHERSPNRHHRDRPKYTEREYRYKRSRYSRERYSRNRYSRSRYSRDRYSRDRYSRGRYSRDRFIRDKYSRDRFSRDEDRNCRNKSWDRGRSRDYDRARVKRRSGERGRSREHIPRKSIVPEKRPELDIHHAEQGSSKIIVSNSSSTKTSKNDNSANKLLEESADCRRDPEKTRRDIQKDKIRCAKDQEARVFQEQLKVAETGLVPPGTELDVILESEKLKKEENKETILQHKKRTMSPDRKLRKKSGSLSRYNARNLDRHERSRCDRNRSFSPKNKRRTRSKDREVINRDNEDLRFHLREKRRRRYVSDLSPVSEARMSRSSHLSPLSPLSNLSDREAWLRNKERYRSRYSRSCSPISSNSLSDGGYTKRKRSKRTPFTEEIKRKLQMSVKSYPSTMNQFNSNMSSVPVPIPAPVPAPMFPAMPMHMSYPHSQEMFMPRGMCPNPYQQQLVMGPANVCNFGMLQPAVGNVPNVVSTPVEMPQLAMQPLKSDEKLQDPSTSRVYSNLKPCLTGDNPELTKLFEDKKISLSDYLSVSAKSVDPTTPINVHNRIKVIARCQDAIKALSEDSKLFGRFFPKPSHPALENIAETTTMKYKSPLRRIQPVRIRFTIPDKNQRNFNEQPTKTILHKLMSLLGLVDHSPKLPVPKLKPASSAAGSSAPVHPPPTDPASALPVQLRPVLIKRTNMYTQTDTFRCFACQIRGEIKYTDQGTQTTDKATFDVSTQVSVEDLIKSCVTFTPRGILKNNSSSVQSISHLTPAQLLAQLDKQKKEEPTIWMSDTFSSSRNMCERYTTVQANPRTAFSNPDAAFPHSSLSSANKDSPMPGTSNYKSVFGGNLDNMQYLSSSGTFKSFSGNPDKSTFVPDRHFSRPSTDTAGSQRSEFQHRLNSDQFNSVGMSRGGRYPESTFLEDPFSSDQPFMDSNPNFGNRNTNPRGRGTTPRGFQGGGVNTYQNRPYFN